jgi:hypothetical protein
MPPDDKPGLVAKFLNLLTTREQIVFGIIAVVGVSGSSGAGYWFASTIWDGKLSASEAKHHREIAALERSQTGALHYNVRFFEPDEENVPKLAEAEPSELTMSQFASRPPQYGAEYIEKMNRLTSIQKPKQADKYAKKAYTWSGYVADVTVQGSEDEPEYCVQIRLDPQKKESFSVTCVFVRKEHSEMMKALEKDQQITVKGVRAQSGRLLNCLLVRADSPPGTPSNR